MADEPRLVGKDGERKTPGDVSLTRSEFMEAMRMMAEGIQGAVTAQMAAQDAKTDALAQLLAKSKEEFERNDTNYLRSFKNVSVFNPRGENALVGGVSRSPINGEVFWVGNRVVWHEQTFEEITLLNQLESGVYHGGEWIVRNLSPDVRGTRSLRVDFPNMTSDERARLPNDYWDYQARDDNGQVWVGQDPHNPEKKGRRVTGMEIMLREMVEEAAARRPVLVTA
jgi:hypothetical protein